MSYYEILKPGLLLREILGKRDDAGRGTRTPLPRHSLYTDNRLLYLSIALRQHRIGLEEVDDGIWSLYFCNVLLGRIDERKALIKGQLGVTHVPG
ncbi:MAG: hypothetical protein ABIV11_10355 [Gemmatimonadaceae bacterium]